MICGISGKIGAGKTYTANFLIKHFPEMNFAKKSFAYKLKQVTSIVSGLPLEDMFTQEGKNKNVEMWDMTVGRMQQVIGTDLFRNWDNNFWIKSLFADYKDGDNWIVSDMRFKNEADFIKEKGGFLIRLEGDPAGVRKVTTRNMDHPSETDLDDYKGFDLVWNTVKGDDNMYDLLGFLRDIHLV